MKNELIQIKSFFTGQFRRRIRNKKFMVWVIVMPIILVSFFSMIGGSEDITADIAVYDADNSTESILAVAALENEERLNVKEMDSLEESVESIEKGETEAILHIPDGFSEQWEKLDDEDSSERLNLNVYYDEGEDEELFQMALNAITMEIDEYFRDEKRESVVDVTSRPISVRDWGYTDLLVPGGMVVVTLHIGLFSSSNTASSLTEKRNYKRLAVSHTSPIYSITGMIIGDAIFTTVGVMVGLLTGMILFGIGISITHLLALIIVIFVSSLIFTFLGCALGLISTEQVSAQGLSFILVFPFIFLSYGYLFSNLFPDYFSQIARYLPIYPMTDLFETLIFHNISLYAFGLKFGLSLVWLLFSVGLLVLILKRY